VSPKALKEPAMHLPKPKFPSFVMSALVAATAGVTAHADDTEIFFNQNNGNVPANVLFILDTSGSMNDLVTSQVDYDSSQSYKADKCAGNFDTNYFYYSTKGVPACASTAAIKKKLFTCAAMLPAIKATGFANDAFVQWGSTVASSKKAGTTTTTYAWQPSLSSANATGYVECKMDAGVDGDGSNLVKLFASSDKFSLVVNTKTGAVVSDGVSSVTGATTGIWDVLKNYFSSGAGKAYTIYDGNYLNYLNDSSQSSTRSKISTMQSAVTSLLTSLNGINVGLMRYDQHGSGGMVMVPMDDVGKNRATMISEIQSWAPTGVTPLSETLWESYLYWTGGTVNYGNNSYSSKCNTWNATNGQCTSATTFSAPSVPGSRTGGTAAGKTYDSPADYSCRKNFMVYLTDGLPNEAATADPMIKALGVKCDATVFSGARGGQCLAGLSGYMYQNDMRPDVAKVQNVTSYYIGFGTDFSSGGAPTAAFQYLQNAATAGGGQAYSTSNLNDLTDAFNSILLDVIKTNTTFSAPAVAVNAFNRTQTLNDLYVSVFSPRAEFHWPGNIKKYKVVNSVVVDSLGVAAVDPNTGFFVDTAQSYWSSTPDGADVTVGGAASKLPDYTKRTVLTYTGTSWPTKLVPITDSSVTDAILGIGNTGDPTHADLINYTLGQDVGNDVPPAGITDTRHEMGDPIHTQPVAVIYGKNGDGTDNTVIYAPTNDGFLHAINAIANPNGSDATTSGQELWSYIPNEMLPHLVDLFNNDPIGTKHYGIDGAISVLKYDVNGDGTVNGNDRVILFFGTGRNADTAAYYALDVTDKNTPVLLWKIDATTLTGLGQAWSTPQITRVNVAGTAQNTQKLALVIGGGYDASEDNKAYYSSNLVGNHIFMVDALYGTLLWSAGSTGASFNNARMDHAIPSPVSVLDMDGDGYADRMYVGDMAGQVWRFDITNGNPAGSLVAGGVIASLGTHDEAVHAAADQRRFYSMPDVAAEQKPKIVPFMNIAIGSGYRGHPLDNTIHDRFYSVRDYNGFRAMSQAEYNSFPIRRDALSALGTAATQLIDITAMLNPTLAPDATGWQLDFNTHTDWTAGEKSLTPSRTFSDKVIFTTYSPSAKVVTDPCAGVGTGTNRVYVIDVFSGSPVIDRNNDGSLTNDERSQDLRQGGIAPDTAFLFSGTGSGSGSGNGNGGPGGGSNVTCLSGVEVLNVCTTFNQRRKTYWREGMAQ
jgi:type IV pilus assembly protein PilY1